MKKREEIALLKNDPSQLKQYFEQVLMYIDSGEKFPVDFDLVWPLAYRLKADALRTLKKKFVEGTHYIKVKQSSKPSSAKINPEDVDSEVITAFLEYVLEGKIPGESLAGEVLQLLDNGSFSTSAEVSIGGDFSTKKIFLTAYCLEHFIARKVPEVFEVYRKVFHAVEEAVKKAKNARERRLMVYKTLGKSAPWMGMRFEGMDVRIAFMNAIKEHGGNRYGCQKSTDSMYSKVFGKTAKEIRAEQGLVKSSEATRDNLKIGDLAVVKFAESLAIQKMDKENANGNSDCIKISEKAGAVVKEAHDKFMDEPVLEKNKPAALKK